MCLIYISHIKKITTYSKKRDTMTLFIPKLKINQKRHAIVYRNRYVVQKADFVVACISHDCGGAYKTYKYAKRLKKKFSTSLILNNANTL